MKTNRGLGFALFLGVVGSACVAACGGNQADTIYGADGAVLTDASLTSHIDSGVQIIGTGVGTGSGIGTTPDSGVIGSADTGATGSGTGTTPDSGITTTTDGGGGGGTACPSSCTTDSECASACPATAGAVNCCDTVTSACFMSAASVCPDQMSTGGGGGTDSGTAGY